MSLPCVALKPDDDSYIIQIGVLALRPILLSFYLIIDPFLRNLDSLRCNPNQIITKCGLRNHLAPGLTKTYYYQVKKLTFRLKLCMHVHLGVRARVDINDRAEVFTVELSKIKKAVFFPVQMHLLCTR